METMEPWIQHKPQTVDWFSPGSSDFSSAQVGVVIIANPNLIFLCNENEKCEQKKQLVTLTQTLSHISVFQTNHKLEKGSKGIKTAFKKIEEKIVSEIWKFLEALSFHNRARVFENLINIPNQKFGNRYDVTCHMPVSFLYCVSVVHAIVTLNSHYDHSKHQMNQDQFKVCVVGDF